MSKPTKQNHVFTGVFIPAKIWIHKGLIPQEKMMLGEIKALSEDTGWCFANNKHFAEWLGCGIQNVSNYIQKFQKERMIEVKYSDQKTHAGRNMRVNMEWYHGLANPYTGNEAPYTGNEAPYTGNEAPYTGNVTEIQFKSTSKLSERGDPPTQNLSNLKEEKKGTPKVALKGSTHVGNYEPSKFDMYGIQPLEILEGDDIAEIEAAALKENNEVWAKITDPKLPGVILVEAVKPHPTFPSATPAQWQEASEEIQPIARAATILEAEEKILNWAKTDGLETLKFRHGTAKRKFVEDELPALVAHYVSVFASTNEGSRANLMRDPVANFEAGMFKYLTTQNTIDRNNATSKPGTHAQQPGQTKNKASLNHWGADPAAYNEKQKF